MKSTLHPIEFRPKRQTRIKEGSHSNPTQWTRFIDELLADQQSITAVERFATWHDSSLGNAQERYFRDLIPLTKPAPGEQYAFEVDMDRCSSCKACVTACHSLNGLEPRESWRNVGLLLGSGAVPAQKTVTTACHHCIEPACQEGCPVLAYDKDPITGIVRHLDDQCIGCQYCVMKCPYDVPKYSSRLGIVRKCDMCSHRLAASEAPACVQACPNEAIQIVLVKSSDISARYRSTPGLTTSPSKQGNLNLFLQDSPPPDYTLPTTRFKSTQPLGTSLRAADILHAEPADPHTPLVFMLVLSQAAVGLFTLSAIQSWSSSSVAEHKALPSNLAGLGLLMSSMAAGTTHLGRPSKAWKSFLGWRRSWLSRELLAFGAMLPFAVLTVVSSLPAAARPASLPSWAAEFLTRPWFSTGTALIGLAGVLCSVMIYADTRRSFWRLSLTAPQFLLSIALSGIPLFLLLTRDTTHSAGWMAGLMAVGFIKLLLWSAFARFLGESKDQPDTKSARLLWGPLRAYTFTQWGCLVVGSIFLPAAALAGVTARENLTATLLTLLLCWLAEGMERHLFFRAVVPWKMPGGVPS